MFPNTAGYEKLCSDSSGGQTKVWLDFLLQLCSSWLPLKRLAIKEPFIKNPVIMSCHQLLMLCLDQW